MTKAAQAAAGAGAEAEGAAEPDALDALDAALGEDEPTSGEGGEPSEWTPPSKQEWEAQKAAFDAAQAKLKRARTQAQTLREKAKGTTPAATAQPGAEPADGTPTAAAGPDPQVAVWQSRAVRAAAKVQLLERGADPDLLDLALARLRPDEIDFNKDDEPELEDWLDELEERHPKLFVKTPPAAEAGRRPLGGVDQGRAVRPGTAPKKRLGEQIIENARRAQGRR